MAGFVVGKRAGGEYKGQELDGRWACHHAVLLGSIGDWPLFLCGRGCLASHRHGPNTLSSPTGDNSCGQLGVGPGAQEVHEPQPLKVARRWACLAMGPSHSAAVTGQVRASACGWRDAAAVVVCVGGRGSVGIWGGWWESAHPASRCTCWPLHCLHCAYMVGNSLPFLRRPANGRLPHSLATPAPQGEVYTWGLNDCAQLGMSTGRGPAVDAPRRMELLVGWNVRCARTSGG